MELKLIKNDEKYILTNMTDGSVIEEYLLTNTIDFSRLMNFLFKDELNNKMVLLKCDFEPSIEEKSLITLLENVINKYNSNIDLYNHFLINETNNN